MRHPRNADKELPKLDQELKSLTTLLPVLTSQSPLHVLNQYAHVLVHCHAHAKHAAEPAESRFFYFNFKILKTAIIKPK